MGLCIEARSCKSHYSERLEEYTGKSYGSTDIGYFGFKFFRDALMKFATNGTFTDISKDKYFDGSNVIGGFMRDDTLAICMLREDFSENDIKEDFEAVVSYLNKLDDMKQKYPKLYSLFPLIAHCDCEGEIPYEQCRMILPVLKEFYETDKHNYGYSGWDYNFTEELINVITECIKHKGKLLFC